ncbi:MAG: lipopolysaccharide biosynthesis protein [Bacteroidota bacterium]|jgi:O-antigen/teichoic acid export membrane protein
MKVTAHLGAISWSMADKLLYVGFGFVQFLQIAALPKEVYGVFTLLVALNSWIMMVSDGSALAGVIQFGVNADERPRVNLLALMIHVVVVLGSSGLMFLLREPLTDLFRVEEFVLVAQWLPLYCLLTLPRMFCLKILYRDMRMRDLFFVDAVWFGVRTALTIWAISQGRLTTFEEILVVDFAGMGASSLIAVLMTRKDLIFSRRGTMTTRTYLGYGLPLAAATALNTAPKLLDVYVIAAFFDVGVVGVYNPAKNLYRIFEQGFDAVTTLMYPAAVRMYAQRRIEDLQTLVTKAVSYTLLPIIVIVAILELGASNLIITFLTPEYATAVDHFNVLITSALIMPLGLLGSIILAAGQSASILRYSAVGVTVSFAVLVAVGYSGQAQLVGLGLVANIVVVSILYQLHVHRILDLPLSAYLRVLPDVKNLVARRLGRSR